MPNSLWIIIIITLSFPLSPPSLTSIGSSQCDQMYSISLSIIPPLGDTSTTPAATSEPASELIIIIIIISDSMCVPQYSRPMS